MPNSMAPDHIVWAYDNRAAMVRVVGQPGDACTRLENRVGEPAANPYLHMASQIAAGLDGVATAADPGPSADTPYSADAPMLPKSLMAAIAALRDNTCRLRRPVHRLLHQAEGVRDRPLLIGRHRLGAAGVF